MKSVISWIDHHLEEKIIFVLYFFIVILMFVEVIKRYVFSASSPYVSEISTIMFMWMIFIGIPYGVKEKGHIIVDVLPQKTPPLINLITVILADVIIFIVMIILIYYSYEVLSFMNKLDMKMDATELPSVYFMSISIISFMLTIIRLVQNAINSIKKYKHTN